MEQSIERPSRAPVYVVVIGFAVAITLILYALRGAPAPPVAIDQPGRADAPRDVNVILRDYLFQPTPITLVRGETVRFVIINGGLEPHEFVLGDASVQEAWARADAAATPPAPFATSPPASVPVGTGGLRVLLASGAEAAAVYTVPQEGDLQLMCHLPGHVAEGMIGRVELRRAAGG